MVLMAIDKKTRKTVVLKEFLSSSITRQNVQRRFQEIAILYKLGDHENIISLVNILPSENDQDIYLVYDYMETDLHAAIRENILDKIYKQFITYQIIRALKYIHSAELIHCELKPSNILLNSNYSAKITNFFYARTVASEIESSDDLDEEICAR